ncbi:hypothetical protein Tco_0076295, partial [Tanacetum coccineum]
PTSKPKVPAPVPTGRQNRPFPVPTSSGYSPLVTSSCHMQYGGVRWATAVKPSACCSWKTHRKGLYWENPYSDAEDEGIFDSGCSRSMTDNMERLDVFQEFQGGKVTVVESKGRTVAHMVYKVDQLLVFFLHITIIEIALSYRAFCKQLLQLHL